MAVSSVSVVSMLTLVDVSVAQNTNVCASSQDVGSSFDVAKMSVMTENAHSFPTSAR